MEQQQVRKGTDETKKMEEGDSFSLKKLFGGHVSFSYGPTETPFFTSGDVFYGFQSHSGQPCSK